MKKLIINVLLLNIVAAPCLLLLNDIDPLTGEWNWHWNVIGLVYSVWFYHEILKPIFKPMM